MTSRILFAGVLAAAAAWAQDPEKLIKASDCSSCHAADHQVVGPAYSDMAKRYAGQADAPAKLAAKIRDGGGGMTPHADMPEAQRIEIAKWILSQTAAPASQGPAKTFAHTLKDGTPVQLDFPVFAEGKAPKVAKDVFHGYQLYNSYCYRCHGTDATESSLAPDLRRFTAILAQKDFQSVVMAGREDKGMPSWRGFLSEEDVQQIYKYVKGRSLELVPSGRPPSEYD